MNKKNPENFDDDCTRVAESFKPNKEDNIQEKNPYPTAEGVKMGRISRITPKVVPEKVPTPSSLDKGEIFIEGVNILKLPKEFIDFYFLEVTKARKVADLYKEQGRKEVIEDEINNEAFMNGRKAERKDILEIIKNLKNPYPYDIFPKLELSTFEGQGISRFLETYYGFKLDRLSAEIMRRARENVKQELLKSIEEI